MEQKTKILIVISLGIVLISSLWILQKGTLPSSKKLYCQDSNDCRVMINCGYCGDICVPKGYKLRCDPYGPKCEYIPYSSDLVCGCINNTCQFSHELFVEYEKIKNRAKKVVDIKEAVQLCDRLHGEYIFECYADLAEELILKNVSKAIKICAKIKEKDTKDIALKGAGAIGIMVENDCYYRIATKIVKDNPNLAIKLCENASTKPTCHYCISYRAYCARYIK